MPTRALVRTIAVVAACAAAASAHADPRVRVREFPVPTRTREAFVAGADDGSATVHTTVLAGNASLWRRTRVFPDGTTATADAAYSAETPFTAYAADTAGNAAYVSTAAVVRLDAAGVRTTYPGAAGRARAAALRDGLLYVLEERPDGTGRTLWGAEVIPAAGVRIDVPDVGVIADWRAAAGETLPGHEGVTRLGSDPVAARIDEAGRLRVVFRTNGDTTAGRARPDLLARAIDAAGSLADVPLPSLPDRVDPAGLFTESGDLIVNGTRTWLVRRTDDRASDDSIVDIAAEDAAAAAGSAALSLDGDRFPGRPGAEHGVASDGALIVAAPDLVTLRRGATVSHTLRLVWHRYDRPKDGRFRERRRTIAQIATTSSGSSPFEARAFRAAVAPDGSSVVAAALQGRNGGPVRLRVWVLDGDGRPTRRLSRRVPEDVSLAAAACGDLGFLVLVVPDTGNELRAIHLLR